MTADEMKKIKEEYGLSYEDISRETGLPVSTVSKLLNGFTKAPRRKTVEILSGYFMSLCQSGLQDDAELINRIKESGIKQGDTSYLLHESLAPYYAGGPGTRRTKQRMTIEERDRLPEELRTELIDGVLYDMSAPTMVHQMISMLVSREMDDCIEKTGRDCMAILAPLDVVLAEEPATVLQPDMIVTCRENIERSRQRWKSLQKHQGAPEFVMEVISPSTKKRDSGIKYMKYLESGVKEYWIVDPVSRKVIVYDFDSIRDEENHADICYLYNKEQKVPVLISGGKCEVDFPKIWEKIDSFLGE